MIAPAPQEVLALDPIAFVRRIPPFHALPEPLFEAGVRWMEIGLFPAGTRLVAAGGEPLQHLYVIRKGAVRLERRGQVLQVLEEGEAFGYTSLLTGQATLDVVVEDDLLAYRLPAADFAQMLSEPKFAAHFAVSLTDRLRASLEHSPVPIFEPDLAVEVHQLVRRAPVWADADATVGEVARLMAQEQVSSVLLRCDPPGIVTDRDLRNRVLAEDLGPEGPAAKVCSRPLRSVAASAPVYEAWRTLLDAGVNHLPVVLDGSVVGVVTSTDLLKHSAQGPIAVLRRVERLGSRDRLPGYATKVTEMVSALLAAGLDAAVIGGFVSQLNDALLRRVTSWAEADLGRPPAPYAWLVFGSEGRREQTLLTDQDNALVYAEEGAARREWYQAFAERVNADLEAAGFPPCPAGRMARAWSGTVSDWVRQIAGCMTERPYEASILFDLRRAGGSLDVQPLEDALLRAPGERLLVRSLAKQALGLEPPAMLLLRLRGRSSRVDLKRHGLSPVVFLARCYAVELGSRARSTLDRLDEARKAGVFAEETHDAVAQAYRFLLGLRLRRQLRAIAAGHPPTNEVLLSELTAIERSRLKDSFRAIKSWQDKASHRYQPGLL